MLSIIIVDYNTLEETLEYIKRLEQNIIVAGCKHYIIVDNYIDRVESIKILKQYLGNNEEIQLNKIGLVNRFIFSGSTVDYVFADSNLGYAKGNNLGVQVSIKLYKDDYVLISNNDIEFNERIDFSEVKKIFDDKKDVAIIGPRIRGINGEEQSPHRKVSSCERLLVYYWSLAFSKRLYSDLDYNGTSKYCYWVMGCFLFVRMDSFLECGMFDENTFMYSEEMILSERLLKKEKKCFFVNDICIIHNHGVTVKKTTSILKSLRWSFESVYYYFKEYRMTPRILLLISKINFNIYIILYKIKNSLKGK